MQSETAEECRILDNLLYLLTCEWPIPQEKMAGKRLSMLNQLRLIGPSRLKAAVSCCIAEHTSQFCPSTSIIVGYAPAAPPPRQDVEAALWRERMAPIRAANPDDFFGEADVVAMMRISSERKSKKLEPLDADTMIAEVLKIRHAIQEKRA